MKRSAILTGLLGLMMLSACASKPILAPNEKYNRLGQAQSERDVDYCMDAAEAQLKRTQGRRVLKSAATGAIVGGAVGALTQTNAVGGALGGAAIGGGAGALVGMKSPEAAKRGLVNYCLQKKGYVVAGWEN